MEDTHRQHFPQAVQSQGTAAGLSLQSPVRDLPSLSTSRRGACWAGAGASPAPALPGCWPRLPWLSLPCRAPGGSGATSTTLPTVQRSRAPGLTLECPAHNRLLPLSPWLFLRDCPLEKCPQTKGLERGPWDAPTTHCVLSPHSGGRIAILLLGPRG